MTHEIKNDARRTPISRRLKGTENKYTETDKVLNFLKRIFTMEHVFMGLAKSLNNIFSQTFKQW
jgi:hypothetical protein